ncbi:MAG: DoxX family protein [Maribacter sp.]|uniref:DoxX family protein n=1 Tax=Maribacter sp. 2307UL18-2 TaxID=3386274 RepID=UPI0039BC3BA7
MNNKTRKIIYLIATSLLTLMVLATLANGIFNPEFTKRFVEIGFPTYLIIPLMTAKAFGILALWTNRFQFLKEWAYSGFFFVFLLAMLAEINANIPDYFSPPMALIFLLISYVLWKKELKETKMTVANNHYN